jgi:4-amino-4-deoxy-L-arabinose transferase-like glycosyltransferase
VSRSREFGLGGYLRSPLLWLVVLYLLVGVSYALVTPMLEKPDEEGHYGYIRYLRERRALPPLHPPEEVLASNSAGWFLESKQPPLYYLVAAALTSWLPDIKDDGDLLVLNRYMDFSVPGYRNDNRNQYLHPPYMTPVVLGSRLTSLAFGLGTMLVAYWITLRLSQHSAEGQSGFLPDNPWLPLAVAAIVGFHPNFLYITSAVNNDAAMALISTSVIALLLYRLQKGHSSMFPLFLGLLLGLASITKVSGLVLFPLVALALLLIHRGVNRAFLRDGAIVLAVAFVVGGWWYVRNAVSYSDPFTVGAHTSGDAQYRPLLERLGHDLSGIEHTFWANPARTFVSEIWVDEILLWWGRIGLALLVLVVLLSWSRARANLPTLVILLSWPLTYVFLLVVYWNAMFRWPFGRLLFPAIVPLLLLLVWGWQAVIPKRLRRSFTMLGAGTLVVASILIPFVSLYPLYRPWSGKQPEQAEHQLDTVYVDPRTGQEIARLVSYHLPEAYATSGTYHPIELCWEPLGQTDVPYAMFVQLLDLSQLDSQGSPGIWGRRETYPGLGNLPTDRWPVGDLFCDRLLTWVYPGAPTPLGAGIEVGFVDPDAGRRLQPLDTRGQTIPLAVVGSVSILAPETTEGLRSEDEGAPYVLGDAIGLKDVGLSGANPLTVTLTWQSLLPVAYDATVFVHLKGADGDTLAQTDRQPLDGRFPTSFWVPGQIITDVIRLESSAGAHEGPLTLNVGMYTWPSLERLAVRDAAGTPQGDNAIVIEVP